MYGILGEHKSDAATLKVLVRRLLNNSSLKIKAKGFDGASEMLKKGAKELRLLKNLGCKRFIICHDADGPNPSDSKEKVQELILKPSKIDENCCVVVPVQEIESWILADIKAVTNIFSGWRPQEIANPESRNSPKEHLRSLSRQDNKGKPRYDNTTHNEKLAKYLDLAIVREKCPSFKPLVDFVSK